ncbi:hypothetical protein A2U01_0090202, partial [Trifolium medium]|nr:hypothetical protein [Trifolium medium]
CFCTTRHRPSPPPSLLPATGAVTTLLAPPFSSPFCPALSLPLSHPSPVARGSIPAIYCRCRGGSSTRRRCSVSR